MPPVIPPRLERAWSIANALGMGVALDKRSPSRRTHFGYWTGKHAVAELACDLQALREGLEAMFREVELLRDQARAWGGDIIEISEKQFEAWFRSNLPVALDEFSEAPFTSFDLGVHWSSRTIYYADYPKGQPAYPLWTAIVHEMGHVFASLDLPGKSTEFSFFGWEHQVAKLIVGDVDPWYRAQRDYGVDGGDFGDYPRAKQEEIVQAKIIDGVSLGILDADGNPQVLTRPTYPREAFPKEVYARMETTFAEAYRGRSPAFAEGYESAMREAVTILSSMMEKPRPVPEAVSFFEAAEAKAQAKK